MRSIIRIGTVALAASLLAACGDGDGGGGGGGQPPTPPPTLQEGFGVNFAAAFDNGGGADDGLPGGVPGPVDTTAEPNPVAPGDIIPVSFTTDPADVPNP